MTKCRHPTHFPIFRHFCVFSCRSTKMQSIVSTRGFIIKAHLSRVKSGVLPVRCISHCTTVKLCSQLARVRVKSRVCAYFCWLLGRHAYGNAPKWKFQHVGIFSAYQARTSVHASHIDWRGQQISTRRCRTR